MLNWRRFKEGDERYLSIIYKELPSPYEGFYILSHLPMPGDLYIPVHELGEPKTDE